MISEMIIAFICTSYLLQSESTTIIIAEANEILQAANFAIASVRLLRLGYKVGLL